MAQDVFVYPKQVVDFDDIFAGPILIAKNGVPTSLTSILTYQTKPGKQPYIAVLANDVDAGGIGSVYFTLRVNGISNPRYTLTVNQWSSPQLITRLPVRILVPQLATVTVDAYNASTTTDYNAFARIQVEYEDF